MNKETFEELFKAHFVALTAYALKFIPDQDEAKEIVHMVFVNLWDKKDTVGTDTSLKPYLYRGVHNRCLNYLRDHKKYEKGWDETSFQLQPGMTQQDDLLETEELKARIDKAIQLLPEKCRQIFLLSRMEDLKYKEIADRLNISVKTVEVQIGKALKILREKLIDYLMLVLILCKLFIN